MTSSSSDEQDRVTPTFDQPTCTVRGHDYSIRWRGSMSRPPPYDIFHYIDSRISFYFRASRKEYTTIEPELELRILDDYTVIELWGADDTVLMKLPIAPDDQSRALRNIVEGLRYMTLEEHGRKPIKNVVIDTRIR